MNVEPKQLEFFEFLVSLNKEQLGKYFLMLGPEESEYVRELAIKIGTQLTLDLNLELAELFDGVEDLADAKSALGKFTIKGNV
jgi:hypothetical protein